MDLPSTLFDKFIGRKRPLSYTLIISLVLFLLALIVGASEYGLNDFLGEQHWRNYFLPPAIISYLLFVAPWFSQMDQVIVESLRPLVKLEEEKYLELVQKQLYVHPVKEMAAIIIGVLFAIFTVIPSFESSWLVIYLIIMSTLTYGLLFWVIYLNISTINFIPTLMRQPLKINPFDIQPFNSIGRQSLLLAIVFAGGITLSMIFIFDEAVFQTIQFWIIYIPLGLFPAIIFYSNMIPTHRVISQAKEEELEKVRTPLFRLYYQMLESVERNEIDTVLTAEINALSSFEKQLKNTPTWPYDFSMLRTLFFSILLPGLVIILKSI